VHAKVEPVGERSAVMAGAVYSLAGELLSWERTCRTPFRWASRGP
jgi:hypothetical protein